MAESAEVLALPAEGGASPQWPQPGRLWSWVMIAKYGAQILMLEAAFNYLLKDAPVVSEVEQELTDELKGLHRDMWPVFTAEAHLENVSTLVRSLPLSGVEKKLERILSYWAECEGALTDSASDAYGHESAKQDEEAAINLDEEFLASRAKIYDPPRKKLAHEVRALRQHVIDELEEMRFLLIAPEYLALYEPKSPLFGDDVFKRFSVANEDIAEAGKCLALGQGTAAVFHLMRVTEAGLRALGAELGVPYAPSWESYSKQLDTLLDPKNYNKLSDAQKAKRDFYRGVLGDIVAVKQAWRNPTMHIVSAFDVPQARLVFDATKSLMQHLAKELSADPSVVISTGQSSP
jgi:hypothetical protein